jgi:signal transduction histidine kinase
MYAGHHHCELEIRTTPLSTPYFELDKDQFIRVINNLLNNAVQAIPEDKKGHIDVAIRSHRAGVLIRIQDNGNGIPDDMRARIFTPYFTTKSTGTGLGLAMVKNMVQSLGGSVYFWTRVNHGTSFFVFLPKTLESNQHE